jgi:hypothetical protein
MEGVRSAASEASNSNGITATMPAAVAPPPEPQGNKRPQAKAAINSRERRSNPSRGA